MKLYDYLYSEVFNKLKDIAVKENKKKSDAQSFETDEHVASFKSKSIKIDQSQYKVIFNSNVYTEGIKTTEISFTANGRFGSVMNLGVVKVFSSLLPIIISYIKSHDEKYYSFSGYKTTKESEQQSELSKREKIYVGILKSLKHTTKEFKDIKIYRTAYPVSTGSYREYYYVFCPFGDKIKSPNFKEI